MSYAWCCYTQRDPQGLADHGWVIFNMYKGSFTEADFMEYFVLISSGLPTALEGADLCKCRRISEAFATAAMGTDQMWQCAYCSQHKVNSVLTRCILHICLCNICIYTLYIYTYYHITRLYIYATFIQYIIYIKYIPACTVYISMCDYPPVSRPPPRSMELYFGHEWLLHKNMSMCSCSLGIHVFLFNNDVMRYCPTT